MSTVTIDLDAIRTQVLTHDGDTPLSPYHDLDYLNTNVSLTVLHALKIRLDEPTDLSVEEKQAFSAELMQSLRDYRARTSGIKNLSDNQLVKHCADTLQPDANNIERVAARTLRAMSKDTHEVKQSFDEAMNEHVTATQSQTTKDIVTRNANAILDVDGVIAVFDPTSAKELTGEQLGFINTLWNQGQFAGGQTVPIILEINRHRDSEARPIDAETGGAIQDHGSKCYVKKDGDKTYIVHTKPLYSIDISGEAAHAQVATIATIVDITELKGDAFTPGCASGLVSTKVQITGDKDIVGAMSVPEEIRTTPSKQEQDILMSCTDRTEQIGCNIVTAPARLTKYLTEHVREGVEISPQESKAHEREIANILLSCTNNESQIAETKQEVHKIMSAVLEAPSMKTSWKESITNTVNRFIETLKDKLGLGAKVPENSASRAIADKMRASLQAHSTHASPPPSKARQTRDLSQRQ